jgi:FkbM family methyltransferase
VQHIASTQGGAMVRIGAHLAWKDNHDPLGQAGLKEFKTLMVEPQPHVFKRLTEITTPFPLIKVVNAAVCGADSNVTFYSSRSDVAFTEAASTSREHVIRHMDYVIRRTARYSKAGTTSRRWAEITRPEDLVVSHNIPCLSLDSLLTSAGFMNEEIRVITVDAEGLDFDIVRTLTSRLLSDAGVVIWESVHLKTSEQTDHSKFILYLETRFGFDCRGVHGLIRAPLNAKVPIDKDNVWCIHPRAGQSCKFTSWIN